MEPWQRELNIVAVGVAAAALVELLLPARRASPGQRLAQCLLGGGLAAGYARLIPRSSWGARSGAGFAQTPLVLAAGAQIGRTPALKLGLWGALAGLGLKRLPRAGGTIWP